MKGLETDLKIIKENLPDFESSDAKIETLEGLVEKFLKVQEEMV